MHVTDQHLFWKITLSNATFHKLYFDVAISALYIVNFSPVQIQKKKWHCLLSYSACYSLQVFTDKSGNEREKRMTTAPFPRGRSSFQALQVGDVICHCVHLYGEGGWEHMIYSVLYDLSARSVFPSSQPVSCKQMYENQESQFWHLYHLICYCADTSDRRRRTLYTSCVFFFVFLHL